MKLWKCNIQIHETLKRESSDAQNFEKNNLQIYDTLKIQSSDLQNFEKTIFRLKELWKYNLQIKEILKTLSSDRWNFEKCYIIKELFFYINHFSLIIFYHSVWLGFEPFGLRVQMHSHWVQMYAFVQRIWLSPFVIINLQTGNGAGLWMTSCPEEIVLRIWRFWKNVSWDWTMEARVGSSVIEARVGFWPLKDVVEFFGYLPIEILDITRCAARWGGVSIVWLAKTCMNCVSLLVSPWTEVKKLINRSYLKQQSPPEFVYVLYYCCDWHHQIIQQKTIFR